jgi:hypothetical protein
LQELISIQRLTTSATSRARRQLLQTACDAWHAMLIMLVKHTRRTKCSRTSSGSCRRTCNAWTRTPPMCMVLIRSNWPSKAHLGQVPMCRFLRSVMVPTKDHPRRQAMATATVLPASHNQVQCKALSMAVMDAEHLLHAVLALHGVAHPTEKQHDCRS